MNEWQNVLVHAWKKAGVREGDTILLHSNCTRLLRRLRKEHSPRATPDQILDTFIEAVGKEGALYMPTFNFSYFDECPDGIYDILRTPSKMGVLTECARKRFGRCNGHVAHSFACSKKVQFVDNKEAFSLDSPFAQVLEANGKIAVLDLPENESMTFYHFVECFWKVFWRFSKTFEGTYIYPDGRCVRKEYEMYVKHPHITTQVDRMGEYLWKKGVWRGDRHLQGWGLRVAKAEDVYQETTEIIHNKKYKPWDYLFHFNDSDGWYLQNQRRIYM